MAFAWAVVVGRIRWILAFALGAEFCVNVVTTAVTTVILARFVVVLVITSPITFPFRFKATWLLLHITGIQALALGAEFLFNVGTTAVTTVILAGFYVVNVVAVAISLPIFFRTCWRLESRVHTLALSAEFRVNGSAAITTVPITTAKIVSVVARPITLELKFPTWYILFRAVGCHC